MLARRHQLLGQQVAHPAGALDRPDALADDSAHPISRSTWPAAERTRSSPNTVSLSSIATAVCDALCGSTPIITAHRNRLLIVGERTVAGMSDFRSTGARASFEPHHGETRRAGTSFGSQTIRVGRRFQSQPVRISRRYDQAATPKWIINQTVLAVPGSKGSRGPVPVRMSRCVQAVSDHVSLPRFCLSQ